MTLSVQVRVKQLPQGCTKAGDFELVEAVLPELDQGQILVRNEWMSLDPYMRLGLTQQEGYVSQICPGDILGGAAVGVVEISNDAGYPVGTRVLSNLGWRSHYIADAAQDGISPISTLNTPPEWHLGLLGLTGVTAWIGIEDVLQPVDGETIFISGAAGAVGAIACQLAKLRGARVLASVGSDEKANWLVDELGVDATVNYRSDSLTAFLDAHAPAGVDCYFDNVGGHMLETFLTRTKPGGRIGLCGAMSQYEEGDYRAGPANFFAAIENNLRLEGFNAFRLPPARREAIVKELMVRAESRLIRPCQALVEGIEQVPNAFEAMFSAGQCGKLVVRI